MKSAKIDDIRSQYKNEWLLITVDEVDKSTGQPVKGTLISHSKSADELWEEAEKHSEPVMVLYSDDWPEDLAACFFIFNEEIHYPEKQCDCCLTSSTADNSCARFDRHQHIKPF